MRVLLIHSDYIKYQVKNKTPVAEEIEEAQKNGAFDEALVVFSSIEKEDEENPSAIVNNLVAEVIKTNEEVNAEKIVLYPYAHLSSSLGAPKVAVQILKDAEEALKAEGLDVFRVPFGWYKAFEISCKGHPLSELSRTITADVEEEEEKEEKKPSTWLIFKDGETFDPKEYNYESKDLEKLVAYELGEGASDEGEPPHVKIMRETPIFYDLANDAIREHAAKFGERQYKTATKKDLMLRFACCFGAFRVLGGSFLTWKNLPAKVYELSTYSFRFEKRGEVVGLKRLRAFTMPDMHSFCADMPQALEEFDAQVDMCVQTGVDLDVNYEAIFRATKDFYDEHKDWMEATAKRIGKPLLLEILPERKHYWSCKIDFAAIDYLGRPIENPTVQIDVESGRRFNIEYVDENEDPQNPIILHCSPTGSVERVICSLLENTAKEDGKAPMLPIWLSPSQVRILPIGEKHLDYANELADKIAAENIRVDVDNSDDRVGKKIRNASKEWIPYIVVIGDKEVETDNYNVTVRKTGEKVDMTADELIASVKEETEGMPFRRLPLPRNVAERINFK